MPKPCWWEQGKLIPTQSNAFPTQIMRWKDIERSKSMANKPCKLELCRILRIWANTHLMYKVKEQGHEFDTKS